MLTHWFSLSLSVSHAAQMKTNNSRTHIDIHGRWFPKEFRNWFSDDWFSIVYGDAYTKKPAGVTLQHKHHTVGQRYTQKGTDVKYLLGTVQKGRRRIRRYIMKFYPHLIDTLVFKRNRDAERSMGTH